MPSSSLEKSGRVVYVDFVGNGGMLHYAESLSSAMVSFTESSLVLPRHWELPHDHKGGLRKLRTKYNPSYYYALAERVITLHRPRLVHITSKTIGIVSFVRGCQCSNIPVVYTLHDPVNHEEHYTAWGRLVERYHLKVSLPWVLRSCHAIHVHSDIHAKQVAQVYGEQSASRVYVVPHGGGVTSSILAGEDIPNELSSKNDKFTFLFFGRIEPYKGVQVLLAAFQQVSRTHHNCRLLIAGAGALPELANFTSGRLVVINRFIKDAEVKSLFEQADAVILPYLSATQTGVIPLAYEFARPVICSDVGALSEMFIDGETGLMVPPGNVDSLAVAMQTLADNPEKATAMGKRARSFMAHTFSWNIVARHHHAKYAALIQQQ